MRMWPPLATQASIGDVLGLTFYLVLVAVGIVSIVAATIFTHRRLYARGSRDGSLAMMTIASGLLYFLGLWLIFDLYWIGRQMIRFARRNAGS